MAHHVTPRNLPTAQGPVYLVLLWPDQAGLWKGRIKDARTGAETPFEQLEELLHWLETHKYSETRRSV